jgi:hypothetical protein
MVLFAAMLQVALATAAMPVMAEVAARKHPPPCKRVLHEL